MTNGYYVVLNAIDPWNRIDAWFENYHPPTSQFYPKVQEHEQKHIDDLNDGFDGHVFINKQEFVPWIIGLTNSTLEGLDALVKEEFKRYLEEEVAEMNSLKSVLEDRAYGVSDAIVPFYVYQGECGGLK